MLDTLITSKTRLKLLLKFFLNENNSSYLRNLEIEFNESTNAIRLELNRFEDAGLLKSFEKGNKKMFQANRSHPFFKDIKRLLHKYVGIDSLVESIIKDLGDLKEVYLTGDLARGRESEIVDLIFIGAIDTESLIKWVSKAEKYMNRKVRYVIFRKDELNDEIREQLRSGVLIFNRS